MSKRIYGHPDSTCDVVTFISAYTLEWVGFDHRGFWEGAMLGAGDSLAPWMIKLSRKHTLYVSINNPEEFGVLIKTYSEEHRIK